jgi:hypothetical protein
MVLPNAATARDNSGINLADAAATSRGLMGLLVALQGQGGNRGGGGVVVQPGNSWQDYHAQEYQNQMLEDRAAQARQMMQAGIPMQAAQAEADMASAAAKEQMMKNEELNRVLFQKQTLQAAAQTGDIALYKKTLQGIDPQQLQQFSINEDKVKQSLIQTAGLDQEAQFEKLKKYGLIADGIMNAAAQGENPEAVYEKMKPILRNMGMDAPEKFDAGLIEALHLTSQAALAGNPEVAAKTVGYQQAARQMAMEQQSKKDLIDYQQQAQDVAKAKEALAADMPNAQQALADSRRMQELNKKGTVYSGYFAAERAKAGQTAGISSKEAVADTQEFDALSKAGQLLKAKEVLKGAGSVSDNERKLLADSLPALGQSPEGRGRLLDVQTALAERKVEKLQFVQNALAQGAKPSDIETIWNDYADKNPVFVKTGAGFEVMSAEERAAIANAKAKPEYKDYDTATLLKAYRQHKQGGV